MQANFENPEEAENFKSEIAAITEKLKDLNKNPPIRHDIKTIDTRDQIAKDILRTYFPQ